MIEAHNNKSKPKKTTTNNNSKMTVSNEHQETNLAQKYYISSLENKVNYLESTVSLLKTTLNKSEIQPSVCQQNTPIGIDAGISETSGDYVLKSVENRLCKFETQLMNNLSIQSQLNFQNHMNIQNQLAIQNTQLQIASTYPRFQSILPHFDHRYGYINPNMTPIINPGLLPAVPQVMNQGVYPMHAGIHVPLRQTTVIPTPVMVLPPSYPYCGPPINMQPRSQQYQPYGIQLPMQPHAVPSQPPNLTAQVQNMHIKPQYLHVPGQATMGCQQLPVRVQTPVPSREDIPGLGTNTQLQPLATEQATDDGESQPDTHTDNMLERALSTIQHDDVEPSVIIQGHPMKIVQRCLT